MGQHADDFVNMCIDHEAFCHDYLDGNISCEEAFEAGIIDSMGSISDPALAKAIEDSYIPTVENLQNALSHAEKDLTISTMTTEEEGLPPLQEFLDEHGIETIETSKGKFYLNKEASESLYNDCPTCNICREEMHPQDGKFGKFYYCNNRCEGQGTVSDKYWQKIRKKMG